MPTKFVSSRTKLAAHSPTRTSKTPMRISSVVRAQEVLHLRASSLMQAHHVALWHAKSKRENPSACFAHSLLTDSRRTRTRARATRNNGRRERREADKGQGRGTARVRRERPCSDCQILPRTLWNRAAHGAANIKSSGQAGHAAGHPVARVHRPSTLSLGRPRPRECL